MISEIIFLTLNTLFINISENYIHELSHNHKYGGFLYKAHHKHHAIDYPPTKLMKIKDEMDTDTRKPYVIVIGTGYGIIYTILPLYYYLIFLTYTSIYLLIVNELHNHYHYKIIVYYILFSLNSKASVKFVFISYHNLIPNVIRMPSSSIIIINNSSAINVWYQIHLVLYALSMDRSSGSGSL